VKALLFQQAARVRKRICDEANPCNQADFSLIAPSENALAFHHMLYNYMNVK
jgi:hypothetical protein